jgi:Icc-related predicted phosphoesterase
MTIKTRICMLSDTHTSTPHPPTSTNNPYRHPLPKANILLHAGDLTKVGYRTEHETTLSLLASATAELKLVIAGNHDITLDPDHFTSTGYTRHQRPERLGTESVLYTDDALQPEFRNNSNSNNPDKAALASYAASVRDLWTSDAAREAGIIYLDEGTHSFTLSTGAKFTIYASPYSPEFYNWAFAYPRSQDRYNPNPQAENPVPEYPAVDIMLTHGPAMGILDFVPPDLNVGCEHLLRAVRRARPRVHLFGHIHEGWGARRGIWHDEDVDVAGMEGGVRLEEVGTDVGEMLERRGAFVDVSLSSEKPLRVGEETLFVNGSVMDVGYEARNAPWVVDLELPVA